MRERLHSTVLVELARHYLRERLGRSLLVRLASLNIDQPVLSQICDYTPLNIKNPETIGNIGLHLHDIVHVCL